MLKLKSVNFLLLAVLVTSGILSFTFFAEPWQSKFVQQSTDGALTYVPDEQGNIFPDFSHVGFYNGDKAIPDVPIVKTINAASDGNSDKIIHNYLQY